jgi:hypothetical protein
MTAHDAVERVPTIAWNRCPTSVECSLMPTERLSMRCMRDLLRLKFVQGMSDRAIVRSLGLSEGTVGNYLMRFNQAGLSWPLPFELDD